MTSYNSLSTCKTTKQTYLAAKEMTAFLLPPGAQGWESSGEKHKLWKTFPDGGETRAGAEEAPSAEIGLI